MPDPTKTSTVRQKYIAALNKRWRAVKKLNRQALKTTPLIQNNDPMLVIEGFDPETITRNYMAWMERVEDAKVLEVVRDGNGAVIERTGWQDVFVRNAYLRGVVQSDLVLRRLGQQSIPLTVGNILSDPVHSDALNRLYNVNYDALQTVINATNDDMAILLRQTLTQGYADQLTIRQLSKAIQEVIEGRINAVAMHRSRMIARTEIIAAHADATLNTFENRGILTVRGNAEILTAGDNRVCSICSGLQGVIFSIARARGIIPIHPQCRCTWIPVIKKRG